MEQVLECDGSHHAAFRAGNDFSGSICTGYSIDVLT